MEYHELEKTHKDHPVQALALQRTPKNPPLCWERCPNPNPWGLCPMTLWGKNFFQKSNLNPSAQTPAVYQLLPTSQPLFTAFFTSFWFLQSFTSAPFCSSSSTQSASATMQAQCRGLRVPCRQFTSAPWGAQEPPPGQEFTLPIPSERVNSHKSRGFLCRNCRGQELPRGQEFPPPIPAERVNSEKSRGFVRRNAPGLSPTSRLRFTNSFPPNRARRPPETPPPSPAPGVRRGGRKSLESLNQPEVP